MKTLFISTLLSLFNFLITEKDKLHDFHLSRCEVNYETKSGDIQVAAHLFIDDFENALELSGRNNLNLCTDKESPKTEKSIEQYFNQKLIFKTQNKTHRLSLLGKETSSDKLAVWCYLEIKGLKNLSGIDIENKILTELFNDQKNIVDFTVDKKKKHFTIFDSKKENESYQW